MGGWKTRLITALPFEKPTRVKNNTTHSSVKVCASTRRSRPSQAAASISINFSPAPVIITLNRAVHPTLLLLPSPSPQPQPPAPRYRLETCNILGQAVEPDINTFKERRRWTEEGNNRILLPNNKVLFNFQTSVKLRIHLCSLPMLAAVTMPVQNKQCGRKNQTKPDLPFISPSGGHTVTATAWPPINAATNPRRVMAKIGSGGIQILLENRLSGKPNNKLGVRENKSGKLHRTNPNSPEEKLKSIET